MHRCAEPPAIAVGAHTREADADAIRRDRKLASDFREESGERLAAEQAEISRPGGDGSQHGVIRAVHEQRRGSRRTAFYAEDDHG